MRNTLIIPMIIQYKDNNNGTDMTYLVICTPMCYDTGKYKIILILKNFLTAFGSVDTFLISGLILNIFYHIFQF